MPVIDLSERQFQALLLPAAKYKEAICVHNADYERLLRLCANFADEIVLYPPLPGLPTTDLMETVRLLKTPSDRQKAMIFIHWPQMPRHLLRHMQQVRL